MKMDLNRIDMTMILDTNQASQSIFGKMRIVSSIEFKCDIFCCIRGLSSRGTSKGIYIRKIYIIIFVNPKS